MAYVEELNCSMIHNYFSLMDPEMIVSTERAANDCQGPI